MKLAAIFLGLMSAFVSASPAAAQWTGTRIGRDADADDGMEAVEVIAKCFVERHPSVVRQWLETLPGTPEEHTLAGELVIDFGNCMAMNQDLVLDGKKVSFSAISLRRPVARMMAARALANGAGPGANAQPWFMTKLESLEGSVEVDTASLALQDFGHCVATKDWEASRSLLLSSPGSAEEQGAVKGLIPSLGPCLTADVKLTLTPANLRDVLAEPAYHMVSRPAVSAAASAR